MYNFDDTFLARWIAEETSVEENIAFKDHPNYAEYLKIREAAERLSFSDFDEEKSFSSLKSKIHTPKKSKVITLYNWVAGIAASAVLVFGFLFFYNQDTKYASEVAAVNKVKLLDNSLMILNASSEALVDESGWDEDRSVYLDGEAFFKVQKGSKFTVNTELGTVQVLGTEFTVNKVNESLFVVKCFEGKVKVTYNAQEKNLTEGMALQIDNGTEKFWKFNSEKPSWLVKNETELNEVSLFNVLTIFERQYNITFNNLKVLNLDTKFTGSFTNENLTEALYSVFGTLGVDYELANEHEVRLLSK